MDYTFSVGTDDPRGFAAENDTAAIAQAVAFIRSHQSADLSARPEAVTVLLGPAGLVTRPSERLDEFVERLTAANPATDPDALQPGDTNTPDCNGD